LEDVGPEIIEKGSYADLEEIAEEEFVAMEEGEAVEEPAEPSVSYPEGGLASEPAGQLTDEALESVIREKLSEEETEAMIRRVVTETIEKKADRILLEVAEAAIAREIERLKQAL
jgi:hypothetical protein